MYKNVYIAGVGTYHPKRILDNEYYTEHFKKFGISEHAIGLANKLGRDKRTLIEDGETSITMGIQAALKAVDNSGFNMDDIDSIISVSDTPEYLTPCCALIFKNRLKANNVTNVFDMNNDCIGMITAMDVASKYLKTDRRCKRILVIGVINMTPFAREDDMVTYSCISDGAAAVVLELKEEDEAGGFMDYIAYTDASYNNTIRFPKCGLSNIAKDNVSTYDRKMEWNPFDFSFLSEKWTKLIGKLLKDNKLKPDDIDQYFMSQFSKQDIKLTMNKLGIDISKAIFIGDKYGYTGCTSPVMALEEKNNVHKFKSGDKVIFCSVGGGYTMAALLYQYR